MPVEYTIYNYTLKAGSSLSNEARDCETRRQCLFLLEDPSRNLPASTTVYTVLLHPFEIGALLGVLNDGGCAVERLVDTIESRLGRSFDYASHFRCWAYFRPRPSTQGREGGCLQGEYRRAVGLSHLGGPKQLKFFTQRQPNTPFPHRHEWKETAR